MLCVFNYDCLGARPATAWRFQARSRTLPDTCSDDAGAVFETIADHFPPDVRRAYVTLQVLCDGVRNLAQVGSWSYAGPSRDNAADAAIFRLRHALEG